MPKNKYFHLCKDKDAEIERLKDENKRLLTQLVEMQERLTEQALTILELQK